MAGGEWKVPDFAAGRTYRLEVVQIEGAPRVLVGEGVADDVGSAGGLRVVLASRDVAVLPPGSEGAVVTAILDQESYAPGAVVGVSVSAELPPAVPSAMNS